MPLEYPADTTPPSRHPPPDPNGSNEPDVYMLDSMFTTQELELDLWEAPLKMEVTSRLKSGISKEVLRVKVTTVPFDGREMKLVCKAGYGKRYAESVKNEATIYHTKLASLQGNVVPMLYGCYVGQTNRGLTAVLLLEDCGRPLRRSLRWCPVAIRKHIIAGLVSIHRAGVEHGDFEDRNIVIQKLKGHGRDGELWPMIVDFGDAQVHDCAFKDKITFYAPKPPESQIKCQELYKACSWAHVWVPSTMLFLGRVVPVSIVTTPEELAKKGRNPLITPYPDDETVLRSAKATVEELAGWHEERRKWDNIPLIISDEPDTLESW